MKIGLEVHVALPTRSKLFCSCSTADADQPNTNICPTCMGLPGSKPYLNGEAVRIAKSVCIALGCVVNGSISFVRKTYFYPDLPKSYQITQIDGAIGRDGKIKLENTEIRIRRVQIEEDPAKLIREDRYSLIDFNRSGTPLVEIVTEPDIKSEKELKEFLYVLWSILYYLGIDIDKEIKTDLNISLGSNRVEVKNVTGIKNLLDAAAYEASRQASLLSRGNEPVKETRRYDERSQRTEPSREKESEEEYGYIYETDLEDYDTSKIKTGDIEADVRKTAKSIASRNGLDYDTIMQLVAFDRHSLSLLNHGLNSTAYDPSTILNVVEAGKRFGSSVNEKSFSLIAEYIKAGVQIDKEIMERIRKGLKPDYKTPDKLKIREFISKELENDPDILKRYRKNPKVIDFIVDTVSRKYGLPQKSVAEEAKKILTGEDD